MVRGTIFSRALKIRKRGMVRGIQTVWGTVCTELENKKASYGPGDTNSLGNCLYPSLETRKRGQFGEFKRSGGPFEAGDKN